MLKNKAETLLNTAALCIAANGVCLLWLRPGALTAVGCFLMGLFANGFGLYPAWRHQTARLRLCHHGLARLRAFLCGSVLSAALHIVLFVRGMPWGWALASAAVCVLVLSITFWHGIIVVYCTSVQLGIRQRVVGALCGWLPLVNIAVLLRMISKVTKEEIFETEKEKLNASRREQQICATRYPLVLVHGVFFRDFKYFNYWGRIPAQLTANGAQVFYGAQQSAASVADSAAELAENIKKIVQQTGSPKVNIIAHSKGGLDCRYAIAHCGLAQYTASLTTVSTPHRGCGFVDYLLTKVPQAAQQQLAKAYNGTLRRMGDKNPDFLQAVNDLTAQSCAARDKQPDEAPLGNAIFCQSVGSTLVRAAGGRFPLNYTYRLAKHFNGPNDGLVAEESFAWGQKYTLLRPAGKRGISHGDMIDLNRENIDGFDVREFYVQLAADLKQRGL